jgi:hypothetical protein
MIQPTRISPTTVQTVHRRAEKIEDEEDARPAASGPLMAKPAPGTDAY